MNNMLPTPYQNFIALSRYARWTGEKRETWSETVDRYIDNIVKPLTGEDSYIKQDELNEKDHEIAELKISDPFEYEKLLAQEELVDED